MGIPTGPLTVGPTIAEPACTGCDVINDWLFSLVNTPGDTICSAMINYLFVINIKFFLKN